MRSVPSVTAGAWGIFFFSIFYGVSYAGDNASSSEYTAEKFAIIDHLQTNLAKLTSFYAKGRLVREYSNSIEKKAGLEKGSFTDEIEIWAKANSFRVKCDRENTVNDPIDLLELTVTPDKIYCIQKGENSVGYVKSRKNALDFEGMRDFFAPILPYSFLAYGHGLKGLIPFSLNAGDHDLKLKDLKNFRFWLDSGKELISFERGSDRWQIQIKQIDGKPVPFSVKYATYFEGVWYTVREVEVEEYFMSDGVGPLAKSVVVKAYQLDRNAETSQIKSNFAARFKFDLDLIEINQIKDESVFDVDFASSVDSIWDADNKIFVEVPK